jgi:cold shock CspA family protein
MKRVNAHNLRELNRSKEVQFSVVTDQQGGQFCSPVVDIVDSPAKLGFGV